MSLESVYATQKIIPLKIKSQLRPHLYTEKSCLGYPRQSSPQDNFTQHLYDKKLAQLTEIKLTLLNYNFTLIFMTSIRHFPSEFFVDFITVASGCLNVSSLVYIFVDFVVFKPKTSRYVTRGTQNVVPGRRDKVFI